MNILLIDTGSDKVEVAFLKGREVIRRKIFENRRDLSNFLFGIIEEVMDGEKVEGVLCVKGPGHFTSLRIGVVAAMGLSLAWEVPKIGALREEKSKGIERLLKGESDSFIDPSYDRDPGIT